MNGYMYEIQKNSHKIVETDNFKLTKTGAIYNKKNVPLNKHKLSDTFNLKNSLKLKIEDDKNMIVTPYWISMNPIERIYFITNKYNIVNESNNYKQLIQVPNYFDSQNIGKPVKPYYNTPFYDGNTLTYQKTIITGLNRSTSYTSEQLNEYKNKKRYMDTETSAFTNNNLAYQVYSLQFHFEPLSSEELHKLS